MVGRRTSNRSHAVVNAGHENVGLPGEAQSLVHDGLVVADDVDARELGEDLDQRAQHEAATPLRDLEHDQPSLSRLALLGIDSELDLVELSLDPFLVAPVVVQLPQDLHAFLQLIRGNQMSGRLGKPDHTDSEQDGRDGLERKRETPLE